MIKSDPIAAKHNRGTWARVRPGLFDGNVNLIADQTLHAVIGDTKRAYNIDDESIVRELEGFMNRTLVYHISKSLYDHGDKVAQLLREEGQVMKQLNVALKDVNAAVTKLEEMA